MIKKKFKDAIIEFSKWKEDLFFRIWRVNVFFDNLETFREIKSKLKGKVIIEENKFCDIRKLLKQKRFFISLFVKQDVDN